MENVWFIPSDIARSERTFGHTLLVNAGIVFSLKFRLAITTYKHATRVWAEGGRSGSLANQKMESYQTSW